MIRHWGGIMKTMNVKYQTAIKEGIAIPVWEAWVRTVHFDNRDEQKRQFRKWRNGEMDLILPTNVVRQILEDEEGIQGKVMNARIKINGANTKLDIDRRKTMKKSMESILADLKKIGEEALAKKIISGKKQHYQKTEDDEFKRIVHYKVESLLKEISVLRDKMFPREGFEGDHSIYRKLAGVTRRLNEKIDELIWERFS